MNIELNNVTKAFSQKGYVLNSGVYRLNVFGIRASGGATNTFNDIIGSVHLDYAGVWNVVTYIGTTDPGTYWLQNPPNVTGTAILMEGQHVDAFKIGLHKGQYRALVQNRPLPVYRDNNKDSQYGCDPSTTETGNFGINLHHAGIDSKFINNWSAGCQIIANLASFNDFMGLVDLNVQNGHGEIFTYTLFKEEDIA